MCSINTPEVGGGCAPLYYNDEIPQPVLPSTHTSVRLSEPLEEVATVPSDVTALEYSFYQRVATLSSGVMVESPHTRDFTVV